MEPFMKYLYAYVKGHFGKPRGLFYLPPRLTKTRALITMIVMTQFPTSTSLL